MPLTATTNVITPGMEAADDLHYPAFNSNRPGSHEGLQLTRPGIHEGLQLTGPGIHEGLQLPMNEPSSGRLQIKSALQGKRGDFITVHYSFDWSSCTEII